MSQENHKENLHEDNEISLRDLILKTQEFGREIKNKILWVFVSMLVFAAILFFISLSRPVKYKGEITFMLEDAGRSNSGGVFNILGQLGLPNQSGGGLNLYKMLDLAKSRAIIQQTLFEKVKVDGKEDYLANHLILEYDFHEDWEDSESGLKGFLFTNDSIAIFNRTENYALKKLHRLVTKTSDQESLLSTSFDEESGIISFKSTTTSSDISYHLTNIIYEKLSNYYITKATEKQQKTYNLFKVKTDSVQNALTKAQSRLARFEDYNRGLTLQQYETERERLQLEIQKLLISFGEIYKNLEAADFALKSQTPFIQIVDEPILPLDKIKESKLTAIITGLLLGLFLSVITIICRKVVVDALQK